MISRMAVGKRLASGKLLLSLELLLLDFLNLDENSRFVLIISIQNIMSKIISDHSAHADCRFPLSYCACFSAFYILGMA